MRKFAPEQPFKWSSIDRFLDILGFCHGELQKTPLLLANKFADRVNGHGIFCGLFKDLQSYLSQLSLFLASESNKVLILVDNRRWLIDKDSPSAHLWQLMVTKSRLSPFANTRARRNRKDLVVGFDLKSGSRSTSNKPKKFRRWFSVIDAALYRKKALLPVKKLRDSLLSNSELRRTLDGFIVFEVAWAHVRGINYLNELQTDTSLALEAKVMKRWEFDTIGQASSCISSWFSGTDKERLLLQEYLESISSTGEVFYDAQVDPSVTDATGGGENIIKATQSSKDKKIVLESLLHTPSPPPPNGPYKRRKIMKSVNVGSGSEAESVSVTAHEEIVSSSRHAVIHEATQYKDVLILFKFNDRDLPFRLKTIIMSDLRLLTLLESGLPSWVIFLQSYPIFCHLYRPWMCLVVRALYVIISITTVVIGFYDLYKNIPVLKVTASRLCGPLFYWIETWEMISRIKYLGTMLFFHNFEKAVKVSLMVTRYIRSLCSILTKPMVGPLLELVEFFLPFWQMCFQTVESFSSVILAVTESTCSIVVNMAEIFLWPMWFIVSLVWRIGVFLVFPIFWALWEILVTPVRLVVALASFISFLCSYIFNLLSGIWLSVSGLFQLASASEAVTTGPYEASMWSSLWNDLFSQIFRALRSILNGFVAFFTTCNRHRLSIYNHMQEFLVRLSRCCRRVDSTHTRWGHQAQIPGQRFQQPGGKAHRRGKEKSREVGVKEC